MKTEVVIYRIISVLLLPLAVLFGFSTLVGFISVLINPSAIFGVLMIGGVVFYIISSFIFLNKGIVGGKRCKPVLRNSIRIGGIITGFFSISMLYVHLMLVNNPDLLNPLASQMMQQPGLPAEITQDLLAQGIKSALTFFMIVSLVLILHIIMSFRLLKEYSSLFQEQENNL